MSYKFDQHFQQHIFQIPHFPTSSAATVFVCMLPWRGEVHLWKHQRTSPCTAGTRGREISQDTVRGSAKNMICVIFNCLQ